MFYPINLIVCCKYTLILKFMPTTCSKKVGEFKTRNVVKCSKTSSADGAIMLGYKREISKKLQDLYEEGWVEAHLFASANNVKVKKQIPQ